MPGVYAKQAQKDAKKIARSNLKEKALELIDLLQKTHFENRLNMKHW
jgi:Txe/YoeB family toxin of Txe-Axe toxin-antitoxin module